MAAVEAVGRPKGHRMGVSWHHWAALAGRMPTSRPKRCTGTEIGSVKGARQTLRTVCFRGHERPEAQHVWTCSLN